MEIKHGDGEAAHGRGVAIDLTGAEAARAILAWVVGQGVHIGGPFTISVNSELIDEARIYIYPSGFAITPEGKRIDGSD